MGAFIRKDKAEMILSKLQENFPKAKLHFSGSTPPEVFVGRVNYPNVFSGILSPEIKGDTQIMSSPEEWVGKKLSIEEVLAYRGQMIYGRQVSNIKTTNNLKSIIQELALSSKPVSTEFFLKRQPTLQYSNSRITAIMANPAPIQKVIIEENVKVEKKVDYITGDIDVKANHALKELYSANIPVSHMQKLFSVGLLGAKMQRKMVPTRWSITAVDDMVSKDILKKVKTYKEINEILVFSDEYNGNHYEIIFLPGEFQFEVIEMNLLSSQKKVFSQIKEGQLSNSPSSNLSANAGVPDDNNLEEQGIWKDYEGFFGRKEYASSVTGGYYAVRLPVAEYLERIKRQAKVLVLREISEEYYAPLGVGILRELCRRAFKEQPQKIDSVENLKVLLSTKLKIPVEKHLDNSWIMTNYKKQRRLSEF